MALPLIEGRWERDGIHQEQATDSVAPAPVQTPAPAPTPTQAPAAVQTPERPPLPRIDFARRQANRELTTDQLLSLLRTEAPRFYELAEVVGKWVWIQFAEKHLREVTASLAQFGFHWNNTRQTWQHPCGALTQGSPGEAKNCRMSFHAITIERRIHHPAATAITSAARALMEPA